MFLPAVLTPRPKAADMEWKGDGMNAVADQRLKQPKPLQQVHLSKEVFQKFRSLKVGPPLTQNDGKISKNWIFSSTQWWITITTEATCPVEQEVNVSVGDYLPDLQPAHPQLQVNSLTCFYASWQISVVSGSSRAHGLKPSWPGSKPSAHQVPSGTPWPNPPLPIGPCLQCFQASCELQIVISSKTSQKPGCLERSEWVSVTNSVRKCNQLPRSIGGSVYGVELQLLWGVCKRAYQRWSEFAFPWICYGHFPFRLALKNRNQRS